jgi:hypothetical protein
MLIAYIAVAVLFSIMLVASALGKLRHDQRIVATINEVIGVPLRWFPLLAACLVAGAIRLLIGIAAAPLGVAAAVGLVAYFIAAIASHVRVGDFKGLGAAAVPLLLAAAALVTRIVSV